MLFLKEDLCLLYMSVLHNVFLNINPKTFLRVIRFLDSEIVAHYIKEEFGPVWNFLKHKVPIFQYQVVVKRVLFEIAIADIFIEVPQL